MTEQYFDNRRVERFFLTLREENDIFCRVFKDAMPHFDIIRIKNASFYAYHGVASDEQNLGGKFEVDVEIRSDLSAAFESDSLKRTVDYEAVYTFIQKTVTQKKYYLLEALAATIAKGLRDHFTNIQSVKVTIRKPHPPVKGVVDFVEVEVTEPHV